MNEPSLYRHPDPIGNEITLTQIWGIVVRRRALVLVVVTALTLLGALWGLLRDDRYQVWMTIEIGQVPAGNSMRPLESSSQVAARLESNTVPRFVRDHRDRYERLQSMAIEVDTPANTDIVNVSTQTSLKSVLETQQILELLAEDLISEHRGLIDAYRSEYESRRASLAGNLEGMRIELARIENQVTELRPKLKNTHSSEATPFALALVELERAQSNYRTSIAETEKELYKITDSLLGIRETRGVSAPVVGTKPEGAGLLVVMLLAFMAGLVLSVLIALVLEFVTGAGATATPAKSPISTTD